MPDEALIKVDHLSRSYGPHLAVNDVSFEVHRGEVLGFLGPNGAGKTTTMQMLTGNLAPSLGQVTIAGADILDQPLQAKAAIGYLPERPPLYRELTVDEYLRYAGRLNRLPRTTIRAAVDHAKERCGLTGVGRRLIGNLSKGYRQRVGIAQAVIHNPPVVILDEPTVGLDPLQIREIRALIRELGAEHSIIISTHILPEVQATCDRVQIIHHGSLVLSDTIEGLSRQMESTHLIVGLRHSPPPAALKAIPGVDDVQTLDDGRLRVAIGHEDNPAEAIARQAAAQDWGLYELSPETMSLEQIFIDITRSDAQHEAAALKPGEAAPKPDEETA
jgi:ABC-2 type transport system ATP-binding protein